MTHTMQTLLAFLGALTLLVFFHELGHYLAARAVGIRVLRFSIGFGPVLLSRRFGRDRTEWALSAIPLGGYVKMLGEHAVPGERLTESERAHSFERASVGARAFVIAAGPMANFVLAALLYAVVAWHGVPEPSAVIAPPVAGSLAEVAGLKGGDRIVAVGGDDVDSWGAARLALLDAALGRGPVSLAVERDGREARLTLDASRIDGEKLERDPMAAVGVELASARVQVASVVPGGAAERAGLRAGDLVRAADGSPVGRVVALIERIRAHAGTPMTLEVERDGVLLQVPVTPEAVFAEDGSGRVGRIGAALTMWVDTVVVRRGPVDGMVAGVERTAQMTAFSLKMFGRMLVGQLSWKQLSGPVTIADQAGRTAQMGAIAYVAFLALVSVSLGTLNLLPLPMLDGGHLVYCAVEAARGRPLSERTLELAQRAGLALIVALSAVALFNDMVRLLGS